MSLIIYMASLIDKDERTEIVGFRRTVMGAQRLAEQHAKEKLGIERLEWHEVDGSVVDDDGSFFLRAYLDDKTTYLEIDISGWVVSG